MANERSVLINRIDKIESKMNQPNNSMIYVLDSDDWDLVKPILTEKWNKELKKYTSELKKIL
jgi:hypothetical protein